MAKPFDTRLPPLTAPTPTVDAPPLGAPPVVPFVALPDDLFRRLRREAHRLSYEADADIYPADLAAKILDKHLPGGASGEKRQEKRSPGKAGKASSNGKPSPSSPSSNGKKRPHGNSKAARLERLRREQEADDASDYALPDDLNPYADSHAYSNEEGESHDCENP